MQAIFSNQPNGTKKSMALLAWLSLTKSWKRALWTILVLCILCIVRILQRNVCALAQEETRLISIILFVMFTMQDFCKIRGLIIAFKMLMQWQMLFCLVHFKLLTLPNAFTKAFQWFVLLVVLCRSRMDSRRSCLFAYMNKLCLMALFTISIK